ncbi:hypothetical protein D3C87_1287560 [compost metagenome]
MWFEVFDAIDQTQHAHGALVINRQQFSDVLGIVAKLFIGLGIGIFTGIIPGVHPTKETGSHTKRTRWIQTVVETLDIRVTRHDIPRVFRNF